MGGGAGGPDARLGCGNVRIGGTARGEGSGPTFDVDRVS